MTCACCGLPFEGDQKVVTRTIETGSGPGAVVKLHVWCQPDPFTQPMKYQRRR